MITTPFLSVIVFLEPIGFRRQLLGKIKSSSAVVMGVKAIMVPEKTQV